MGARIIQKFSGVMCLLYTQVDGPEKLFKGIKEIRKTKEIFTIFDF